MLIECASDSVQRAKSGLGEAPLGASAEGKGSRAHSMLSSHLQGGGRKNSITGVTKRHLGKILIPCEESAHSSMNLMPVLPPLSSAWMLQESIGESLRWGE